MAKANVFDRLAVNEENFHPPAFLDPEFAGWALRTTLRVKNMRPGDKFSDTNARHALCREGTPSPEWAAAYSFMLELSRLNKQKASAG